MSDQPKPAAGQPPSGMDLPTEPWAWAVVDPNGRLRDEHGGKVDMLICWSKEDADTLCDYHQGDEGEDDPHIVELFPAQPADGIDWKQRAEKAEAELAVAIKWGEDRNAVADAMTDYVPDSARELELTQQLTAANDRLAKVREAIARLSRWAELSLFAESILAEAQAELAEGEQV